MKVFKSNQKITHLGDFTQLLAFNFDNEVARHQYLNQAKQPMIEQYVVIDQHKIIATLLIDTQATINTVINGFIRKGIAKQSVFDILSTYFQIKRWPGLIYQLVSNWDQHYLLQRGFTVDGNKFTKIYKYPKYFVFGGGGAHGAFQTGAFDILKAAGIVPDAIIGVSVGAITGMSLMHLNSQTAHEVWEHLTTEKVYGVDEIGPNREQFTKTMINQLISRDFKSKKYLLDLFLPVATKELKQPKIKFTLVTTNAKTLTPKVVTVDESMKPMVLAKWVVASSAFFPVVAPMEIEGDAYIDGGYSNDIPINEAIKQGAKDIYVIDIQGMGRSQRYKAPKDVKIHWIKTKWDLGPMLDFVPNKSIANIALGELEAQKFLGEVSGFRYFFNTKPSFKNFNWNNLASVFATTQFTERFISLSQNPVIEYLLRIKVAKFVNQKIVPNRLSGEMLLEYLAYILEINPAYCYTEQEFLGAIADHAQFTEIQQKFLLPDDEWNSPYLYQHPEVILVGILYLIYTWQKNEKKSIQ